MEHSFYHQQFEALGFHPCPAPQGLPPVGECWKIDPEQGDGYYWIYTSGKGYDIKIHDFSYHEDTVINLAIPECLSVTYYHSIAGEELYPYRSLNSRVVKSFLGGHRPFRALIHKHIPIRSIGIEYRPAYYETSLRAQFGDQYVSPSAAFQTIDETANFPEMVHLLRQVETYRGEGLPASLFYDAKASEALSMVFERHQRLNSRKKARLSPEDMVMLDSLTAYIGSHYADALTIDRLSRIACMGTTKLKRCFKDGYGCTIAEYVQKVRLDQAEHLLAYTDLSVAQVAQAVGYTAAGHFAELFRRAKGMLPMEYRRMTRR
ncbi:MAG: AraC family transcriptional regulator [Clostridia bacterium]|nr:AraC family transcriptional regulator [Clostridia bacterium]